MKKTEKPKAVALELTPRKSFQKVSPELSVGCVCTSAGIAPVRTGELECREPHLGPPGATVQRHRQKKHLAEYEVGKQVEIRLLVEVRQNISGILHLPDTQKCYYWGR